MDESKLRSKENNQELWKNWQFLKGAERSKKSAFRRSFLAAGLAVVALVWVVLIAHLLGSDTPPTKLQAEGKDTVTLSQGMAAGNLPVRALENGRAGEPTLFGTIIGVGGEMNSVVYSGDRILTQDTGKRVVVGVPKGSLSIVYLYPNSEAQVVFQEWVQVNLSQGNVYVQPGNGAIEEVFFPQFKDAMARIQGSRMVVRVLSPAEVRVQCFEGQCQFHLPGGQEWIGIPVGTARNFNLATGQAGTETVMTFTEMWDANIGCGFCLTSVLPSPTLTPLPTFTPTQVVIPPTATPFLVANQPPAPQPKVLPATAVPPTAAPRPTLSAPALPPPAGGVPPQGPPFNKQKPQLPPPQPKLNPGPPPHSNGNPGPNGGQQNLFTKPHNNPCNPSKNHQCP